jgi:hypothetical protein
LAKTVCRIVLDFGSIKEAIDGSKGKREEGEDTKQGFP